MYTLFITAGLLGSIATAVILFILPSLMKRSHAEILMSETVREDR